MAKLTVHRKVSVVNDRGSLFLYMDNTNQGKLLVLKDQIFELSDGKHSVFVKDALGFTSREYQVDANADENLTLIVNCNYYFIAIVVILLSLPVLIKFYPNLFGMGSVNGLWTTILMIGLAILFLIVNRRNLYTISRG